MSQILPPPLKGCSTLFEHTLRIALFDKNQTIVQYDKKHLSVFEVKRFLHACFVISVPIIIDNTGNDFISECKNNVQKTPGQSTFSTLSFRKNR